MIHLEALRFGRDEGNAIRVPHGRYRGMKHPDQAQAIAGT